SAGAESAADDLFAHQPHNTTEQNRTSPDRRSETDRLTLGRRICQLKSPDAARMARFRRSKIFANVFSDFQPGSNRDIGEADRPARRAFLSLHLDTPKIVDDGLNAIVNNALRIARHIQE